MTRRTDWPVFATCVCKFACSFTPSSSAWHRLHKLAHLRAFPNVDDRTVQNLDTLISIAEERETAREQRVS